MDKIERLIAIVMILLQKETVSTTELSRLFNVSKRTVLRDMETLGLSNIPIYSIHGANGGYGIMDEYKIDKRLLNSGDLENILVALGGLGQIYVNREVEVTIKKNRIDGKRRAFKKRRSSLLLRLERPRRDRGHLALVPGGDPA
ncbi:helix-turn-helix transcriptional regulator [Cohnella ginsengisoli]|uniref:helix-turn-helix transcriptional regulator n=1 Tax=Cohnella ginsengisoli TaxID=425004 RepID=UPI0030B914D2